MESTPDSCRMVIARAIAASDSLATLPDGREPTGSSRRREAQGECAKQHTEGGRQRRTRRPQNKARERRHRDQKLSETVTRWVCVCETPNTHAGREGASVCIPSTSVCIPGTRTHAPTHSTRTQAQLTHAHSAPRARLPAWARSYRSDLYPR